MANLKSHPARGESRGRDAVARRQVTTVGRDQFNCTSSWMVNSGLIDEMASPELDPSRPRPSWSSTGLPNQGSSPRGWRDTTASDGRGRHESVLTSDLARQDKCSLTGLAFRWSGHHLWCRPALAGHRQDSRWTVLRVKRTLVRVRWLLPQGLLESQKTIAEY